MDQDNQASTRIHGLRGNVLFGFRELLHELLSHANLDYSRINFLHRVCSSLLYFSGSDMLSIQIEENGKITRFYASFDKNGAVHCEELDASSLTSEDDQRRTERELIPESVIRAVLIGGIAGPTQSLTRSGSFWTGDTARPILLRDAGGENEENKTVIIAGEFPSLALILIPVSNKTSGILMLASRRRDSFSKEDIRIYEAIAETLGVALSHQRAQWALRERVKELTCLYGIDKVASRPGIHLDGFLAEVIELIPPGWQYPEIASARVVLDGRSFQTKKFQESPYRQSAEISIGQKIRGVVEVFYNEKMPDIDEGPFLKEERNLINAIAETIGRQVAHHEAQWALRERVKELTCLYGIAEVASRPGILIDQLLQQIVELLPVAWQYPEITQSRITLDGRTFSTAGFTDSIDRQSAEIIINDTTRGLVEVVYTKKMPSYEEGPFLKEERNLIDEIARQVSVIVEQWETEQETVRLQEQLRHTERLATVGQLSAGVAHELNEPLAAILGFAQLVKESGNLSHQASQDTEKIINAALHAREVIRKLMIFTRQMPARKIKCDLSQLVREGLYFLESRSAKENIVMVRQLEEGLPQIQVDPSQINQVLVNLVVNAIQAMPDGGKLSIITHSDAEHVYLIVKDTGIGMNTEVQRQLFIPFFTTKDVGQGTGLGLAVVHGIVTSHGGTIKVQSEVGKGSSFEICIPIKNSLNSGEEI
jgi:signal transduction histidine kinase